MDRRKFLGTAGLSVLAATSMGKQVLSSETDINKKEEKKDMTKKPVCKITVLRRECYSDLQEKYLADPKSGPCPFFRDGQEFIVDGDGFFHMMDGKFCSEAWDCISRYVYAALQGGSIMREWTNDEKMMIACCNDGTRPVIFKIERIDG